jgi:hypothetical protein
MIIRKNFIIGSLLLLLFTTLAANCIEKIMSESDIEEIIKNQLKIGDSKDHIERFLEQVGWSYVYDEDLYRYQARNLEEDKLPELMGRNLVYLYIDKEQKFLKFEVLKIYP